ncbi:MAG: glycosyltransferase family 39 protein [bacterium]|nr:glycosyltransferase family 39 protein [bacterium]
MKILQRIERSREFWFLLLTSFIFFLLRFPSLFEPYWYGDEGIYQVIGIALRQGRGLYTQIWDNKPPLLYLLYAIFSSDQFTVRLVSLIFGILSVIVFFLLAKKLFHSEKETHPAVFLSTGFFALFFGLPLIEGNIANAENFMILPILISALLILKTPPAGRLARENIKKEKYRSLFFSSGLLLSFAFLFKIVAVFDTTAFFLFLLIIKTRRLNLLIKSIFELFPLLLGFIIPVFLTILFFFLQGSLSDFLRAAFLQNVGYVAYGNTFLFPQSLLVIKLTILFGIVLILFKNRVKLPVSVLFILIWTAFSLFNALFSQRPYAHYFLTLLPSFSLFIGLSLFDKKYQKQYLVILFVLIIIALKGFNFYGKTVSYYFNFLQFMTNQKSISSYQKFFDRRTPIDYEIAQFIKIHTGNDDIFLWGDDAQVYKLSAKLPIGRYTVAYHMASSIKAMEETKKVLNQKMPKYIILVSRQNFPFSLSNYFLKLNIENIPVYEKIH